MSGNDDITYETHVADEQQPEQPEPEQPPKEPEPEHEHEWAPISWLRQAAAEIEAEKGNPNPGRTRQSSDGLGGSPSARPRHTMSESTTGKLHQKDYTPEVDELLPTGYVYLHRLGSLASRQTSRPDPHCFYLRLASSRRHWRSSSRLRNKQETFVSVIL